MNGHLVHLPRYGTTFNLCAGQLFIVGREIVQYLTGRRAEQVTKN